MHLIREETQIPKGCHFFGRPCIQYICLSVWYRPVLLTSVAVSSYMAGATKILLVHLYADSSTAYHQLSTPVCTAYCILFAICVIMDNRSCCVHFRHVFCKYRTRYM